MKRYFLLGTDTDCGKTYVTCQLLKYFKQNNQRVIGLKPVASGCESRAGELISQDAELLQAVNESTQLINPWRFKPPIAPHIAAQQVGQVLCAQEIIDFCFDSQFDGYDFQLIEGAGGLMVPLNAKETWMDFLSQSNIPVILVVGMKLGCINHALLTVLALKQYQIDCKGWIANGIDKDMLALRENIETLVERIEWPLLASIPFEGKIDELAQML